MGRETGYATKKRTEILTYLRSLKDKQVSVSEIQEHLNHQNMEVNITTIYRYLDKLLESGQIIKQVNPINNCAVYQFIEGNELCHEHLHLKCESCGRVYHLDCEFMHHIAEHITGHHNFRIDCQNSVISGICKDCQDTKEK